jgi:hypothetical protein
VWITGSDIRLVDSHPEGDGCHHDIELTGHESFLDSPPPLGVEPRMVAGHFEVACPFFRQALRLLAGRSVYDGRPVFGFDQYLPGQRRALRGESFHDLDTDILAAKTVDEMRGLDEPELSGNVLLNHWRGRGCECQHRDWAKEGQILAKHSIVGAKIVPPLGYTVRLVDRDERRFALG